MKFSALDKRLKGYVMLKGATIDRYDDILDSFGSKMNMISPSHYDYYSSFVEKLQSLLAKLSFGQVLNEESKEVSLGSLAKTLAIAEIESRNTVDPTFFEFGSCHYSFDFGRYSTFSSLPSHFMLLDSGLKYNCFDSAANKDGFKTALIAINKLIEIGDTKDVNWRDWDMVNELSLSLFEGIEKKYSVINDFSLGIKNLLSELSNGWGELYLQYYKSCRYPELLQKLGLNAFDDFSKMQGKIEATSNPIIYSMNVLNARKEDGLQGYQLYNDNPFWNIDKGFHIHSGNHGEMLEKIGIKSGACYGLLDRTNGVNDKYLFKITPEEITKFKEVFNVKYDVSAFLDENCVAFYFWDAQAK